MSYSTSDSDDWEQGETHEWSGIPRTWTEPNSGPQGETIAKGKGASEAPVKTLTVARKSVQKKSCTNLGLHLLGPP